jgi:hypothetical protein
MRDYKAMSMMSMIQQIIRNKVTKKLVNSDDTLGKSMTDLAINANNRKSKLLELCIKQARLIQKDETQINKLRKLYNFLKRNDTKNEIVLFAMTVEGYWDQLKKNFDDLKDTPFKESGFNFVKYFNGYPQYESLKEEIENKNKMMTQDEVPADEMPADEMTSNKISADEMPAEILVSGGYKRRTSRRSRKGKRTRKIRRSRKGRRTRKIRRSRKGKRTRKIRRSRKIRRTT